MKTNTELTRAFESGEISFDQYMTTAAEPEARKPASHYRKSGGKRAAARQGALLQPAEEDVLESNSLCAVCGREAVGFKSLCCEANVITPSEYARRAKRAGQVDVDGTPAEVNATVARANRVEAANQNFKALYGSEYKKVQPGEPDYERIAAIRAAGTWACDSADHNEATGCSNPECFKYVKSKAAAPQQAPLVDPEEGAYVAAPGNLKTAEAALKFLLAGNAYFTVRSLKTGVRYTFRVALAPVKEGCTWCRRTPCTCKRPYFVSFLSGPENTSDYTYLGMVTDSVFRITRASTRYAESTVFKAFDYVFRHLVRRELPPQTEIWHTGRCGVCGRPLTVPESIESGIGPVCAGKEGM